MVFGVATEFRGATLTAWPAGHIVGAVAKLRLSDYRNTGEQRTLRFREKGGKDREIPVRHDLEGWINEYIAAAGIAEDAKAAPLFRAADKTKRLIKDDYGAHSIRQMMKRRLSDAGLPELFSPHSFRVTVVTDLLNRNVPLEDVQYLAGQIYLAPHPKELMLRNHV